MGRVTVVNESNGTIEMDWMVGSYSGHWKEWKGREQGKSVIFAESIPFQGIILTPITISKSMKLSTKTITQLKELYAHDQH